MSFIAGVGGGGVDFVGEPPGNWIEATTETGAMDVVVDGTSVHTEKNTRGRQFGLFVLSLLTIHLRHCEMNTRGAVDKVLYVITYYYYTYYIISITYYLLLLLIIYANTASWNEYVSYRGLCYRT